ncbi:MAG TPA: SRPBCC family protein [Aromatoleum sp.]|uniref:SRPBCC family protein n=1 Tax=Aromatoleum sp. TaxID=2307007 RepID=UPI002B487F97|nr:SRPBCC family protein [Aromatoleum sp.]HJV27194.1 SRPBCC family protein [Aromatoleum sp.]
MVDSFRSGLFALWLLLAPAGVRSDEAVPAIEDRQVHVERSRHGFSVDLQMHAPVSPSLAWAVLTDFDHMAAFVPNLKSSRIVEHGENTLKVNQSGTARYGIVTIDFESVRDIRLIPEREIRSHGVGGNFKHMESTMHLEPEADGTRLQYHADVEPEFWLPPLIGPAAVRHETAEQFSAILQEMVRRR